MPSSAFFQPSLFDFLKELRENNRREWFVANKERYEESIKEPAQRFIADIGPRLARVSPHFLADPRPVGGSLFRIYRDTRFGHDKSPYKTHTGIQFRHRSGKDAHAPGFYLHLEPGNCFAGAGSWHPDTTALARIREAIAADPKGWTRVRDQNAFAASFDLWGEVLSRPPRGFDPEHPCIADLKRKDFVALAGLSEREIASDELMNRFLGLCRAASPFMRFLCRAMGEPY